MTARALPYLEEDERLLPKLTNLRFVTYHAIAIAICLLFTVLFTFVKCVLFFSRQYVGQDYTQKKSAAGKVTLDQIDSVSVH